MKTKKEIIYITIIALNVFFNIERNHQIGKYEQRVFELGQEVQGLIDHNDKTVEFANSFGERITALEERSIVTEKRLKVKWYGNNE